MTELQERRNEQWSMSASAPLLSSFFETLLPVGFPGRCTGFPGRVYSSPSTAFSQIHGLCFSVQNKQSINRTLEEQKGPADAQALKTPLAKTPTRLKKPQKLKKFENRKAALQTPAQRSSHGFRLGFV